MLKLCKINVCPNGTLGLHLSRAPWDPYPWVSGVTESSSAYLSGIRIGDTILEYNGIDVLGWKIFELANKIHSHWDCGSKLVNFLIWRNKSEQNQHQQNDSGPNINQQSLQKFATCLQNIAQLLECPVCLEVIKPPGWQCCNGHVICNGCRCRTIKCPICRVPLGPRGRCLLSDKLFTLLAESFPCDGVKNDNKNGRCPEDNHKIIRKTSSTIGKTENNFLIDKPTSQNVCINNSNSISSGRRIRITTNPKDDENINKKQIISIKVKSPQILSVPVTSQTEQIYSPSVVTILNNTFSSSSSSALPLISNCLDTKSVSTTTTTSSSLTLNQQDSTENDYIIYKNYHCPTGKSCNFQENDENSKMYNTINNFPSTIIATKILHRNNIDNSQNINQNIQWDILTHLRRVHQLFICQYYGSFGEHFQVDLIKQNKSIVCISIDTRYSKNPDIQNKIISNIDNQIENTLYLKHRKVQSDSLYLTVQNFNSISNDTFIPNLLNCDSNDNSSDVTSINSVNSSYKDSINKRNIKFYDTELFFIAKIPLNDENNINDKIMLNLSGTTATTNNIKIISRKSSLTNDIFRNNNNNIFDTGGFNVADINKNIENFSLNTSTLKDCATTITIDDTISSSDIVMSCENFATSSCLPSMLTSGDKEKYAIFIWYCGNECNVKNFKAFIKCNGKIEQTSMAIHSISKSWDVIQCRKEFLEIHIDSDEIIFEIIIDSM